MERDPLDFSLFCRAARDRAAHLHLDADAIVAAHGRVSTYLGEAWLESEAARLRRGPGRLGDIHPVFTMLRGQAERNLLEITELAVYLDAFKDDPAFEDILNDVRADAKFQAVFYELAMAYRWKAAGATIRLAPVLESGRVADFAAEINGIEFIVEASIFPAADFDTESFRFFASVVTTLKAHADGAQVAVELRITELQAGDLHGDVQRAVKAAVKRLLSADQEQVEVDLGFGSVIVRGLRPDEDQGSPGAEWDFASHGFLKERPADGTIYDAHKGETVGRTHSIYIAVPRRQGNLYSLLTKKYEKERRQLSGESKPRVILLDVSGVKHDALEMSLDLLRDSVGSQLVKHPAVSSVWFTSRGWMDGQRFGYRAITMRNPSAKMPLPKEFSHAVSQHEVSIDILTDQKITWSPSIETLRLLGLVE
ncbi:MAG: hypothetical protein ACYC8W_07670 [Candidatus Tyrphobacter sp.]